MNNILKKNISEDGSVFLIIGDRGIGKTYNILKFIPEYIYFNKEAESRNILIYSK